MSLSPCSHAQQARQALALRLAELRREAGLTGRELGRLCGWHPSKTSRIENARTAPTADDVTAWCGACGVPAAAADLIASLRAAEGMWVEWRRMERSGLRQAQVNRLPLYERTQRFRSYSSWLVPGLLQTRSYTAAVLGAVQRRRGLVDDVTEAVDARMDRQRVLHEGDRRFAFLVEESVLRAGVGGAQVMTAQLAALVAAGSLPNVSVGIVPASPDRVRWPVEGLLDLRLGSGQRRTGFGVLDRHSSERGRVLRGDVLRTGGMRRPRHGCPQADHDRDGCARLPSRSGPVGADTVSRGRMNDP